jgi:hypothetical protein
MAGLFSVPKGPKVAPTPTRDDVDMQTGAIRKLRMRRGSGANELMGSGGAEAGTQPKKALMGE